MPCFFRIYSVLNFFKATESTLRYWPRLSPSAFVNGYKNTYWIVESCLLKEQKRVTNFNLTLEHHVSYFELCWRHWKFFKLITFLETENGINIKVIVDLHNAITFSKSEALSQARITSIPNEMKRSFVSPITTITLLSVKTAWIITSIFHEIKYMQ